VADDGRRLDVVGRAVLSEVRVTLPRAAGPRRRQAVAVAAALTAAALAVTVGCGSGERPSASAASGSGTSSLVAAWPSSAPPSVDAQRVFNPVSTSAINAEDFWVLGYTTWTDGRSSIATAIMRTTDGGGHFAALGISRAVVPQMAAVARGPQPMPTVSGIRFADANHGWVFGDVTLETNDGGATWSTASGLPGNVVDLAAAGGTAWAVVQTKTSSGPTFALHRSSYAETTSSTEWRQVPLTVQMADNPPSLAVQGTNVELLADDAIDGDADELVTLSTTGAPTYRAGPCTTNLPARLSAAPSPGVLWATCDSGHQEALFVTADNGVDWTPIVGINESAGVPVAGISPTLAVAGATTGPLELLMTSGVVTMLHDPSPQVASFGAVTFVTPRVGFALADFADDSTQLWRTTNGGQTWAVVTF
jgi:hypothetical protein